jgi:hypothetical protein
VPAIGFYSVEYSEHLGWIGGYLMLNAGGRPLEFHCTLPIRPSRTQEILYGATLRDQLIGEAIPTALLKQSKNQPLIFCSDQPEALRFADRADFPVVLAANELNSSKLHVPTITIQTAQGTLRTEARFADRVRDAMETLAELPDIEEPFARIREAIREAQQQAPARAA